MPGSLAETVPGKTIQAIAAAEIMARLFSVERILVICPSSLKHQWQTALRSLQVDGSLPFTAIRNILGGSAQNY